MDADAFWHGVPYEVAYPAPILTGFREPGGPGSYIFAPGRLHRWKRTDLIIRAFREIDRDILLKIAGTGEDEAALRNLAQDDPRIEFLGRVSDADLLDLYAGARAVAFVPSGEDYGYITIEAFKTKRPVVTCTDSGEPPYIVADRENGFVVDPDPRAIADRLCYLIDNPDEAVEMGRRGY